MVEVGLSVRRMVAYVRKLSDCNLFGSKIKRRLRSCCVGEPGAWEFMVVLALSEKVVGISARLHVRYSRGEATDAEIGRASCRERVF